MTACEIFLATLEHSLEFSKVYSGIFPEKNITLDLAEKILTNPCHKAFLAKVGGHSVGFLYASFVGNEADIIDFGVLEKFRKQGVGARLLNHFLNCLREQNGQATLEVSTDNKVALSLYEKFGFQKVGVRKRYYIDGQDALVYRWSEGKDV